MNNHLLKALQQRLEGIPRSPHELSRSLQMLSEMRRLGWHKSLQKGHPIDKNGSPIPWYSYALLEWLMPRVKRKDVVFEFGAGYSTVWYGQHTKEVIAVEHNSAWLHEVQ